MAQFSRHFMLFLYLILHLIPSLNLAELDGCHHRQNTKDKCLQGIPLLEAFQRPNHQRSTNSRAVKSHEVFPLHASYEVRERGIKSSRIDVNTQQEYVIDDAWLAAHKNNVQDAIDEAQDGDQIVFEVSPNVVVKVKQSLLINKRLTFITRPTPTTGTPSPVGIITTLGCPGKKELMTIEATGVVFKGFGFTKCNLIRKNNVVLMDAGSEASFSNVYILRNEVPAFTLARNSAVTVTDSILWKNVGKKAYAFTATGGNVTATNTTLQDNGTVKTGIAIVTLNSGSTGSFKDCTFSGNKATGAGGAFMVKSDSSLTVDNGYFTKNIANHGACIRNQQSTVKVTSCTFYKNEAFSSGGVLNAWDKGIYEVIDSNFNNNVAKFGSGIYVGQNSSLTITDSGFDSNEAKMDGGAIKAEKTTNITVYGSSFTKNICRGHSGAIYASTGTKVVTVDCTFFKNTAGYKAGAIGVFADSVIDASRTLFLSNRGDHGGAVRLDFSASGEFRDCNFTDNFAKYDGGSINLWISASIELTNTVVHGSRGRNGGGIYLGANSTVTFRDSSITNCVAIQRGGAIDSAYQCQFFLINSSFENNAAYSGGGVHVTGYTLAEIDRCQFIGNSAIDRAGAIYLHFSGVSNIRDSIIQSNKARQGGAIYDEGSDNVTIARTQIDQNTARHDSGAVFVVGPANLSLSDSSFTKNSAKHHGGGVVISVISRVDIQSCNFSANAADNGGGGLIVYNQSVATIANSRFEKCSAINGGAMVVGSHCKIEIENSVFNDNRARHEGGAIVVYFDTLLRVARSSFSRNYAKTHGGVAKVHVASTCIIITCQFSHNTAGNDGGSFNVFNASLLTLSNSSFRGDEAGVQGGSVSMQEFSKMVIYRVNITNSAAGKIGGCLSFVNSTTYYNKMNLKNCNSKGPGTSIASTNSSVYFRGDIYRIENPPITEPKYRLKNRKKNRR
eukprot:g3805.t1